MMLSEFGSQDNFWFVGAGARRRPRALETRSARNDPVATRTATERMEYVPLGFLVKPGVDLLASAVKHFSDFAAEEPGIAAMILAVAWSVMGLLWLASCACERRRLRKLKRRPKKT